MACLAMLLLAESVAQNPSPVLPASAASMVTYYLRDETAVEEYLHLLEPHADYVTANELGTLTFRPFISQELQAVRLVMRFATATDAEAHEASAAHTTYMDSVGEWNRSTGHILRKEQGQWDEQAWGAWSKAGESGDPAGYSQEVTYYMRDEEALEHMRRIQYPVALTTVWEQPYAQTYSPFVSHESLAYRLVCRYVNYSSYADIHRSCAQHQQLMTDIHAYKAADPTAVVSIEKGPWNETSLGFLERSSIILV